MFAFDEWRVRTTFREIRITLGPRSDGTPAPDTALLVSELLFEIGARRNQEVMRVLEDALQALRGRTVMPSPRGHRVADDVVIEQLSRELEFGVRARALVLEEIKPPPYKPIIMPRAPDPEPVEQEVEEELTFIGVEIRDQDGKPVSTTFRIELPDGRVREGETDLDGKARVERITQGGTATITLPGFDEEGLPLLDAIEGASPTAQGQDDEADEDEDGPLEITLVDATGAPLAGVEATVEVDGEAETQTTDADGILRIEVDGEPSSVVVTVADLDVGLLTRPQAA